MFRAPGCLVEGFLRRGTRIRLGCSYRRRASARANRTRLRGAATSEFTQTPAPSAIQGVVELMLDRRESVSA